MTKKRGLGRGLNALIPGNETPETETGLQTLPLAQIVPNPHQPRTVMDEEKLAELAASIKEHGLIQPLIVTQTGDGYTLIAGERRWRASQLAGLAEVPVVVKEATPQAMLELALIENIQRADLNPLEEAYAYQQLTDEFGLTHEQVAQRVGKGRSTITNLIRLLELPENIQQAVTDGRISGAHARALLPLTTPEAQIDAMKKVIKLTLSVRQTEALVKLELQPLNISKDVQQAVLYGQIRYTYAKVLATLPTLAMQTQVLKQIIAQGYSLVEVEMLVKKLLEEKTKVVSSPPKKSLSAELIALQTRFEQSLGTHVDIKTSDEGGQVVIHYYSDEELQAIYDAIVGEET
ncbi:MAG: ParB/RepB/Spo0J family partition protein [Ardenticatenaceae bacterium]|nr:ParB/RepB/Spo0J family partition protein [Ardenticatenaceae bacterium]MCB9444181.1 ParB/RepB/Spo0J family partition protein [Ardenticatenaceae bacterium]